LLLLMIPTGWTLPETVAVLLLPPLPLAPTQPQQQQQR
jgi:hypothetical protein